MTEALYKPVIMHIGTVHKSHEGLTWERPSLVANLDEA